MSDITDTPSGLVVTTLIGQQFSRAAVAQLFLALHSILSAMPAEGADYPLSFLITELIGSFYTQADVAAAYIGLHEVVGKATADQAPPGKLEYHYPPSDTGKHWAQVEDVPAAPAPTLEQRWEVTKPCRIYNAPALDATRIGALTVGTVIVGHSTNDDWMQSTQPPLGYVAKFCLKIVP